MPALPAAPVEPVAALPRRGPLLMRQTLAGLIALAVMSLSGGASSALACPFCTAVEPSLTTSREAATVMALAEVTAAGDDELRFRLHRVLEGAGHVNVDEPLTIASRAGVKPGKLVLLFGEDRAKELDWTIVPVTETSAGYFFAAPATRRPEVERLEYFAGYLEHPEPLIAEDAYREFGHANFDAVARVVHHLPAEKLRGWLKSPQVPEARKGLYGLMLGLATGADAQRTNAAFLKAEILAERDDFRAGFDGLLGGYLLLAGTEGLDLIEKRFLANPRAAVGDVRHAQTALRFYHEYGRQIPPAQLSAALAKVLARPEFAEAAIIDLARWQAWEYIDPIAALYTQPQYAAPEIRRAVVGYLLACPLPEAAQALAQLRTQDPQGIAAAEAVLRQLGRTPQ